MHYTVDPNTPGKEIFDHQDNLSLDGSDIVIETSPTADLTDPISKTVLEESTAMHIDDVRKAMNCFAQSLVHRAVNHDISKILFSQDFFDDFHTYQETGKWPKGKESFYDTIHIKERHHLRDRVPKDVDLLDVLEMIADSCMAAMARTGKYESEDTDKIKDVLMRAYDNTVKKLLEKIEVKPPAVMIKKENNPNG